MPEETFNDFQEAGLFRCIQPKRYEGYELDPETFYQAIVEVSAVCGSSGWILGVVGVHNWHLGLFPPQAQEDVWGEDTGVQLSTSLAPTGKVERVPGGFHLERPLVVLQRLRLSASGRPSAALHRRPRVARRPTRACFCCRGATTRSTTTGT